MNEKKLRIVEWNLKTIGDEERKKRIKKIIKALKADVVILTEVKTGYRDMMDTLAELNINIEDKNKSETYKYTAIASNSALNYNNIVIAVLSRYVEGAIFEDYCIGGDYEKKVEIYKRRYEERNHPDRLLVKIRMKDSEEWLRILGIRMQNTGLSPVDKIEQVEALKWEIEAGKPDIVIGDFNWGDAIRVIQEGKKMEVGYINSFQEENGENSIKILWRKDRGIKGEKYKMWPDENDDKCNPMPKSFKGATSPDRVLYKDYDCDCKYGLSTEEISDKLESRSDGFIYDIENDVFISDHDMLIVDVTINGEEYEGTDNTRLEGS